MFSRIHPDHPLRKFFNGLVEQAFMADLGVCDPQLTEYLGEMLVDFVHVDRIYQMRTVDGEAIREISRLEAEAYLGPSVPETRRRWLVNKYIGDFTLFWTGVYPETLRRARFGGDRLREYLLQGKRSYGIAGDLSLEDSKPPAALLRHLSEQFEFCVHGLHLVREGWRQITQIHRPN